MIGWKRSRRRRLRARPLPDAWREVLERRVAHWRLLGPDDRAELAGHVQVLLAEKRFEGCGGQVVDDEVRVTIAAQAGLLLLHRDTDYFPKVMSIVVYPSVYWAPGGRPRPGGVVDEAPEVREGESWDGGAVVLAWDRVRGGAADAHSGENVVLHEFAHQLDVESGAADGAPPLRGRGARHGWAEAFTRAYGALCDDLAAGRPSDLDPYAATNPAEYFAVVTEVFFERPRALARARPELYAQLSAYFQQDPASRDADEHEPGRGFWTISSDEYFGALPIV